jgi:MYXO-CTERM domain-containing protein
MMKTRTALGFAMVSVLALMSSSVLADTTSPDPNAAGVVLKPSNAAQVLMVGSGAKRGRIDGDMRLRYPGFEQTTLVYTKGHIVLITMESVHEPNRGPVQCSCSSYELRPDGPPREVVSLKRLTEYPRGERTCNHPKAAVDENGNIVWLYGSDYNSNRPNTYAGIINHMCEHLAAPQMVSIPRDANDGAPDVAYLGNGNFIAGYYSDGGGETANFPEPGGDYSVAMGLSIVNDGLLPRLERRWITPVVTPTNIGRPTVAAVDATRALLCAPKGPNRPSDSIECGLIDTTTGAVVAKNELFKGGPGGSMGGRKYFNQPTVVKVAENQFALMAIESNGMGKNTNIKGANVAHMLMFERNGDSLIAGGEIVGAAAHQTHASICVGSYGEQGNTAIAVFSAAPTGIGRAAMAMVQYDSTTKSFKYDERADLWPAAWYGDSGHLANWYGRNPMKQGRDYMRCIGGIENPGYHVPNGFMPDVKTFFAGAVHGRIPGDEKNSLFLSLVPGQMDKKPQPANPVPAGEAPDIEPDTGVTASEAPKADSGCGCATPGSSSTSGAAALATFALGLGIVVSRRRKTG